MRPCAALVMAGALIGSLTAGCGMPRDPEGTLDRVRGGTLRAGVVAHAPWVTEAGTDPEGIEVELVERFADSIDAEVEWHPGAEAEVFGALHVGELDLVIGGLTSKTPYSKEGAVTHPFVTTQTIVAFPPGTENAEIAGVEVGVEPGTEAAGALEKTDAVPVPITDPSAFDGPQVIDDWLLDDLGLVDLGVQLSETDHVMAVRMGENAFMVAVEHFLLDNAPLIEELLAEVTP